MTVKPLYKPVLSAAFFLITTLQVDAASISYYLDQSNALPDDIDYALITISDSTTTAGDIDFSVEIIDSVLPVSGSNFGFQTFAFNYDNSLDVDGSNIIDLSPDSWKVLEGKNAGGGFDVFDLTLKGKGHSRTELITFTISGVDGDDITSYAVSSSSNPDGEFFSSHIAGFDMTDGVTSAKFAGSTPSVPVPAALWLLISGLAGLGVFCRKKRPAAAL